MTTLNINKLSRGISQGWLIYKMKLILLTLFITGCGSYDLYNDHKYSDNLPKAKSVDSEMRPYYDRFKEHIGIDSNHIPSSFKALEGSTVGLCWTYSNGTHEIEIDRDYWNAATDEEKEQLIFHELGHCALNLKHNENVIDIENYKFVPESIMYPYIFSNNKYYIDLKDYYYEELRK